uniref:Retrovirus-related Pol polyprotein from transposon TNT 1-94 n=1 Tax=Tanacetum cinerariifolium TaxID=118510 RepID=A0A699H7W5_TANCI|nr:retrovirus-related Pol polyprotein from transposon TNT 1-94 [Tanacetum cinerariifolium]
MALADDELTIGKSDAQNGKWVDITIHHKKDSEAEFLTPLPPLKNLQGASPSSEVMPLSFQPHSPKERPGLGHNRVIHIRGGVLAESSQSNESSIGIKCNTCGSTIHFTSDQNKFDQFKRVSPMSINHEKYTLVIVDEYSRYPPDEFLYEDDPSRQYQVDSNILYYVILHGQSLTKLTQENHVPEVIVSNEHNVPLTEDIDDPLDLINTEGTHEQNVEEDQMIIQPTDVPSRNKFEVSRSITEPLVPDVTQSHIPNQPLTSSHPAPQDR